jgi:archaellum component FlaC
MKVLLRYSGDCFLRWNYCGGSIVSAVPVKAKVFLTLHTPHPAGRYGAGGSRRGGKAGSRHVRAGAVASVPAKDLRVGGASRARYREGTMDEDAWRIRRLEIAVMDIQNRLGALDGDLKGVNAQVSLVREAVGNLQVTTGAIAADVTRVGNALSSAKEELKNEANANKEELKNEAKANKEELKREATANKEELKKEATANKVELKSEATANKVELKSGISNVRDELKSAKEELRKEATANKEELKKEAQFRSLSSSNLNEEDLKSDVRDDLRSVDAELRDEMQRFKGAIWTLAFVCVAAVATALLGADQAAAAINGALRGGK